jgi:SAM-dependent methyltransferase
VRSGRSNLIAEVYDLDKPIDGGYDDVEYYKRQFAGFPGAILELACGSGRILIPLLEQGVDAAGLDHSPEMLAACREHCRDRGLDPVLYESDMANFSLPRAYDVVLAAAGAIKELDGREAVHQALTSCRQALVPGGRLYVDVVPPRLVAGASSRDRPTEPAPMRYWRRDRYLWTQQTILLQYDSAANRTRKLLRYEKWCDNSLVLAEVHEFCLQHWTLWEVEQLLAGAGFVDITVTADYHDREPPGPNNDDWTFRATRP